MFFLQSRLSDELDKRHLRKGWTDKTFNKSSINLKIKFWLYFKKNIKTIFHSF